VNQAQQAPLPPPAPPGPALDPNFVVAQIMEWVGPVAVLLVIAVGLYGLLRTPVGEAIAESIRQRLRRRSGEDAEDSTQRVAALEEQVQGLHGHVAELAERLDFAERLLAERRERKLGAGQ
jgi:hypothetical protein